MERGQDPECVFCSIAAGEIPTQKLYEDELVCAFADLNPQAPVHVLVVPKAHYANLTDGVPAETWAALMGAVQAVAEATGIAETGFRVISNTGKDAGQTVPHLHLHVLGGESLGEGLLPEA